MNRLHCSYLFLVCIYSIISLSSALKKDECEVCVSVLERLSNQLADDVKKDPKAIEDEFRIYCKTVKSTKENRLVSLF